MKTKITIEIVHPKNRIEVNATGPLVGSVRLKRYELRYMSAGNIKALFSAFEMKRAGLDVDVRLNGVCVTVEDARSDGLATLVENW